MIINMAGGSGGLSTNSAVLHVVSLIGSTISLLKNGILVKRLGPEKSHVDESGENANYYFSISPTNYGEYDLISENSGMTAFGSVTIDSNKQYNIDLLFTRYLIRDGMPVGSMTTSTFAVISQRSNCYNMRTNGNVSCFTARYIEETYYSRMVLNLILSNENHYGLSWRGTGVPAIGYSYGRPQFDGSWNITNAQGLTYLNGGGGYIYDANFTLDISNVNRPIYVFVAVAGTRDWNGFINISNLYLEQ